MKRTLTTLLGIAVFIGGAYAAWAYTPLGKSILASWLLKRWEKIAQRNSKKLDTGLLAKELAKLDYPDHELLYRYTLLDPFSVEEPELTEKQKEHLKKLLKKMKDRKILERADLQQLENIVLPG